MLDAQLAEGKKDTSLDGTLLQEFEVVLQDDEADDVSKKLLTGMMLQKRKELRKKKRQTLRAKHRQATEDAKSKRNALKLQAIVAQDTATRLAAERALVDHEKGMAAAKQALKNQEKAMEQVLDWEDEKMKEELEAKMAAVSKKDSMVTAEFLDQYDIQMSFAGFSNAAGGEESADVAKSLLKSVVMEKRADARKNQIATAQRKQDAELAALKETEAELLRQLKANNSAAMQAKLHRELDQQRDELAQIEVAHEHERAQLLAQQKSQDAALAALLEKEGGMSSSALEEFDVKLDSLQDDAAGELVKNMVKEKRKALRASKRNTLKGDHFNSIELIKARQARKRTKLEEQLRAVEEQLAASKADTSEGALEEQVRVCFTRVFSCPCLRVSCSQARVLELRRDALSAMQMLDSEIKAAEVVHRSDEAALEDELDEQDERLEDKLDEVLVQGVKDDSMSGTMLDEFEISLDVKDGENLKTAMLNKAVREKRQKLRDKKKKALARRQRKAAETARKKKEQAEQKLASRADESGRQRALLEMKELEEQMAILEEEVSECLRAVVAIYCAFVCARC